MVCMASSLTVEALPIEKRGLMGDIGAALFKSAKSTLYAKIFGAPKDDSATGSTSGSGIASGILNSLGKSLPG